MKRALFLTAYDRPQYLERALASWDSVRGLGEWTWYASIEPSPFADQIVEQFHSFFDQHDLAYAITLNSERLGVLHHPWARFEELFALGFDFVVRAEDDFRVSTDVLEYLSWAAEYYASADDVASIHGFSRTESGDPSVVRSEPRFDPLLWGTWREVWQGLIGPTWDHDYSTFNRFPGNQSGWDWNLNTRIYPKEGMRGVFPEVSRVDNFGIFGTHSTPENFYTATSFCEDIPPQAYAPRVDIT